MTRHTIMTTVLLTAILFYAGSALGARPMIEKISFNTLDSGIDQITFKLNGANLPSTFALKGERPRVVFDFPDTVPTKAVKNNIAADGKHIRGIRIGIHRGKKAKTRVVFDLGSNDPVEFKQDFDRETNLLVISVFTPGTELPAPPEVVVAETVKSPVTMSKNSQLEEPAKISAQAPALSPQAEDVAATVQVESQDSSDKTQEYWTKERMEQAKPMPFPEAVVPEKEVADEQIMASVPPQEPIPTRDPPGHDKATTIQPLSEVGDKESEVTNAVPVLNGIGFEKDSNRGEMITFKMNNFNPPVVFGIEDDVPRVVCFFKDTTPGEQLRDLINSDGRFVKTIRIGKYRNPDNIRVVLDLVPDRNYDLQQVFFKDENTFMIIIDSAGEKQPAQDS